MKKKIIFFGTLVLTQYDGALDTIKQLVPSPSLFTAGIEIATIVAGLSLLVSIGEYAIRHLSQVRLQRQRIAQSQKELTQQSAKQSENQQSSQKQKPENQQANPVINAVEKALQSQ